MRFGTLRDVGDGHLRRSLTRSGKLGAGALTIMLLLAGVTSVLAQTPSEARLSDPDLTELSLPDLMNVQVEEVYGASKYLQKVTKAPSSVSIITSNEIRQYGYRTLAEILRSVRGVYVTYDRNYTYIGDRGLMRPGDYNSRILLVVDGHRMNEPIYDSMYIGREFPIDVDLIDRVEVIRGPSSSIYGTSAFFAVINVITKRPSAVKGAEVSGMLSSFGTEDGRLTYGHKFKNGIDMLLSSSLYGSAGQFLFFPEFDSPATHAGIARNCDYEQSEQLFTKITYGDFTVLGAFGSRLKGIPTGSYGTVFNDRRNRTIDNRGFLDVAYEHSFADGLDLTARVYYDQYGYDGHYVYDESTTDTPFPVVNNDLIDAKWVGAEFKLTKKLANHKLTAGSELRDDFHAYQGNYDISPFTLYLDNQHPGNVEAAYVEDEYSIRSNLVLNVGARYDHYGTFGGTANPRLGLIYSPLPKTTLKLLYGTAFRAPSDYELYYYAADQRSNPYLMPEHIRTTEVVFEQYVKKHIRLAASGYHYDIRDLISAQTMNPDDVIQFVNVNSVRTNGVEAEVENKWAHGFEIGANYAFQRAQDAQTGHALTNSPRHLANLNLTVPVMPKWISAGLDLHYVSSRYTLAGQTLSGFVVPNLTFFNQPLVKGFHLSATIYNLANTRYAYPGSLEHPEDAIYQDGRTVGLKMTYTFGKEKGHGK
jgi:outer membrane receptor for ferrienterochelin and colicins